MWNSATPKLLLIMSAQFLKTVNFGFFFTNCLGSATKAGTSVDRTAFATLTGKNE